MSFFSGVKKGDFVLEVLFCSLSLEKRALELMEDCLGSEERLIFAPSIGKMSSFLFCFVVVF